MYNSFNSVHSAISAIPMPKLLWNKNGIPLPDSDGKKTQTDKLISFVVEKAKRSDTGQFVCKLKNPMGELDVPCNVKVLDRPYPPQGPLEVKDLFKDRCKLKWKPPKDDGGWPINEYIVEKLDIERDSWTEVAKVRVLPSYAHMVF